MSARLTPQRRLVVIGVGHRDRSDDGIGPAVVDALGQQFDEVIPIVREGDLAVLPMLWEPDDDVAIVDVVISSGPVGQLHEIDPDHLVSGGGMSTHGLNVADGIRLASRLGCLPATLRVSGIGGQKFGYGPISRELCERLDPLIEELAALIGLSATG